MGGWSGWPGGLPVDCALCFQSRIQSRIQSKRENMRKQQKTSENVERAMGIEPTSPAWEAGVITIIRHPQSAPFYAESAPERNCAPLADAAGTAWIKSRTS
ncbi:hypothetical protein PT2222_40372 [Paraburkholderia tropica]